MSQFANTLLMLAATFILCRRLGLTLCAERAQRDFQERCFIRDRFEFCIEYSIFLRLRSNERCGSMGSKLVLDSLLGSSI